ncbi:ribosome maturation factor RimM [Rickettsiaceae bacterium]|nr:ribosome maturation factor RimM [Rickettsiaceae bacterium]
MTKEDKLILLGVISSAHGIKGNIVIKSFTDPKDNILKLPIIDDNRHRLKIKFLNSNAKDELICRLENCNDRNQAELLKGKMLYCLRQDLPVTEKEEFYFEDLINLPVLDTSNKEIGKVINVANYGAGDIIEIEFDDHRKQKMFPLTKKLFPHITEKYVVLNLPAT